MKKNTLLEINFENARCTYNTNMNRYVTKKKSCGKVDMVVALVNAVYLLQQDVIFESNGFFSSIIIVGQNGLDGFVINDVRRPH